jgi:benzil reductase ((S)-benzoin forming)
MRPDMTCITIVTGASRGMGEAIALACAARGEQVLGLSRGHCTALAAAGAEQWAVDLSEAAPVAQRLGEWLRARRDQPMSSVRLINNAGVIAPLRDLSRIDAADTLQALRVGLEAPALLCAAFIAATADWAVPRRVLNISSGLGRRAMAGSASYCAAKAGLDHLSRCLALEEAARPNGARVVSLAPGVIATDMQVQLRGADPTEFADRSAFVAMHDSGQLLSPEAAAGRVLAFLDRADFGEQPVADVRG